MTDTLTISNSGSSPIAKDYSSNNPHLVAAFGGIYGAFGATHFEFVNMLKDADVRKLYLRDFDRCIYHRGLRGLSRDVPETVEVLRGLIAEAQAEKVTFTGHSQGGYASILFGALLDVDEVHAFSPQTFLDIRNRWKHRDTRWMYLVLRLYLVALFKPKYYDLRKALSPLKFNTRIHIYYGENERWDGINAGHLCDLPGVEAHSFPMLGKRDLIKHLRDTGKLREILY